MSAGVTSGQELPWASSWFVEPIGDDPAAGFELWAANGGIAADVVAVVLPTGDPAWCSLSWRGLLRFVPAARGVAVLAALGDWSPTATGHYSPAAFLDALLGEA